PRDDVGEADVTEAVLGVGPVEAQPPASQHEAEPVPQRQADTEVDLTVRVLRDRPADRARLEDADAVLDAAVQEELVETADLLGSRHEVARRHEGSEEAGIVGELDRLVESHSK